jgi:hypothetical protein
VVLGEDMIFLRNKGVPENVINMAMSVYVSYKLQFLFLNEIEDLLLLPFLVAGGIHNDAFATFIV